VTNPSGRKEFMKPLARASRLNTAFRAIQCIDKGITVVAGIVGFSLAGGALIQADGQEDEVRKAVQLFYAAFNAHDFQHVSEYTTEDWEHINPFGGRTRGRESVLKELREVHGTFLKGVTDTPEDVFVRHASRDVAAVTVTSQMSTYTTPDGIRHENERHIRTFVVVKHGKRWLIMQDQNTIIGG
jgi:uncharacterized protein (TIGR02246 family)